MQDIEMLGHVECTDAFGEGADAFGGWADHCTGFVSHPPRKNASWWSIENKRVLTPHVSTLLFGLQQLYSSSNGESSLLKTSINKQAKNKLSSLELSIHLLLLTFQQIRNHRVRFLFVYPIGHLCYTNHLQCLTTCSVDWSRISRKACTSLSPL